MRFIVTFVLMFGFWMALSGHTDPLLLGSGVISSLFVAWISSDILFDKFDIKVLIGRLVRFIGYFPWLMWQIVLSNIDLVYRTLHPKMPINPKVIRFANEYESEFGQVLLANSITLTPGTVTIEVTKGEFIVHAIADGPADGLIEGEMLRRVKKVEGDSDV